MVRHYCAGGREQGGGIGRLVGYIVDTAESGGVGHAVVDTRGPRWAPATSLARLVMAVLLMTWDRIVAPDRIHHIHIAGRGSTLRKLVLAAAARSLGCIHLLHLHDYDYADDFARRPPWLRRHLRHMFGSADRVIVLGQRDRATVNRLLGVAIDNIVVFHNCVPDPGSRERLTKRKDGATILFLGRLSERKGVPELLAALGRPVLAGQRWRAVLAGDGPVEEFRRQAAALGLAGRVTMPGWLGERETRELCAQADILVLPSHAEGMAMAVLEGLAHGLAVVTTRVGAHEEAIVHGTTGVFVPVGDDAALADALARLVREDAEREWLSTHARAHYLARFSMAAYMRQLNDLYRAMIEQHQRVAATG